MVFLLLPVVPEQVSQDCCLLLMWPLTLLPFAHRSSCLAAEAAMAAAAAMAAMAAMAATAASCAKKNLQSFCLEQFSQAEIFPNYPKARWLISNCFSFFNIHLFSTLTLLQRYKHRPDSYSRQFIDL